MEFARYQRQSQLPKIGICGQKKLSTARVLIVGCGALGSTVSDQLARAGVGYLRLVDRDLVEKTNLQRQTLYAESDVDSPKAHAAALRLRAVNSEIEIESVVTEANDETIDELTRDIHLILDGTDNVETRFLLNDASIERSIPWIYSGCIGTEGRCMVIRPGLTTCLRCVFADVESNHDLPTCDSAGILATAAAIAASLQTTAAIQLLTGNEADIPRGLTSFNVWTGQWRVFAAHATPDPACPACGMYRSSIANSSSRHPVARVLCGRNAVQFRPVDAPPANFSTIALKWRGAGSIHTSARFIRLHPTAEPAKYLTVFQDGRTIIHGCNDIEQARLLFARYLG